MRQKVSTSKVNYYPNRHGKPEVSTAAEGGYVEYPQVVKGMIERTKDAKWQNHFEQATLFWNSITEIEREVTFPHLQQNCTHIRLKHIVSAATFELSRCEETAIHEAMLVRFNDVHNDFACKVAVNLGLKAPTAKVYHTDVADGLSMLKGISAHALGSLDAVQGRKAAIIVADGVSSAQVKAIQAELKLAGILGNVLVAFDYLISHTNYSQGMIVGPRKNSVSGSESGITLKSDFTLTNSRSTLYDALILPWHNSAGYTTLSKDGNAIHFFMEAYKHQKALLIYGDDGHNFLTQKCRIPMPPSTCSVQVSDGLVYCSSDTVRDAVTSWDKLNAESEVKKFVEQMAQHRAWNRVVDDIPA
jgi:catalase